MAKKFEEGDKVSINDGAGVRDGVVLRAPGDSYFVDTDHGPIWCGERQVFERGEAPEAPALPGEPTPPELPPASEPTQAEAPAAKKGGRKKKG